MYHFCDVIKSSAVSPFISLCICHLELANLCGKVRLVTCRLFCTAAADVSAVAITTRYRCVLPSFSLRGDATATAVVLAFSPELLCAAW